MFLQPEGRQALAAKYAQRQVILNERKTCDDHVFDILYSTLHVDHKGKSCVEMSIITRTPCTLKGSYSHREYFSYASSKFGLFCSILGNRE